MQTSLAFLSALGAILILNQFPAQTNVVQHKQAVTSTAETSLTPTIWKLELSGGETNCIVSFIPNSGDNIVLTSNNRCKDILPDLDRLSKINTDDNGDIILYASNNNIVARFIESESGLHESIWPQYPLMTLAQEK